MSDDFFYVDITGNRKLLQDFGDFSDVAKDFIRKKVEVWLDELRNLVEENILDRLNVKSGLLGESVHVELLENGLRINGRVYISGVPYARIQDVGGVTQPHFIYPTQAKALAFMAATGDKHLFAFRVSHPGSVVQGVHYMRDAYREMSPKISQGLSRGIAQLIMRGKR